MDGALDILNTISCPIAVGFAVVLVDGLDEADRNRVCAGAAVGAGSIVGLVARQLVQRCPRWLRVLATSRRISRITDEFCRHERGVCAVCPTAVLSCPVDEAASVADVEQFASRFLDQHVALRDASAASTRGLTADELCKSIARSSGGNFLCVELLVHLLFMGIFRSARCWHAHHC